MISHFKRPLKVRPAGVKPTASRLRRGKGRGKGHEQGAEATAGRQASEGLCQSSDLGQYLISLV